MTAFYVYYTYLGAQVREAPGWPCAVPALPAMLHGVGFAVSRLCGRALDRIGADRVLVAGLGLLLLVYLGLRAASWAAVALCVAMLPLVSVSTRPSAAS